MAGLCRRSNAVPVRPVQRVIASQLAGRRRQSWTPAADLSAQPHGMAAPLASCSEDAVSMCGAERTSICDFGDPFLLESTRSSPPRYPVHPHAQSYPAQFVR